MSGIEAPAVPEIRSTGKIGRYSMIGAGYVLLQALLHVPVVQSETFTQGVYYVVENLVLYR